MARKNRKAKTTVTVNMRGVEGKGVRTKPGEYEAEVCAASIEKGDAGEYIKWEFDLEGGGKAWFNTSLTKQSLWNLRGLLEAMGEEVPDSEMDIDLEEMIGKRVGIVIEMEEYKGVDKPKMVDYYSLEDAGEADVKDEKKGKKKGAKEEDADKKTKDEIEDMDRDDLEEFIKENGMSVDPDDYKKDKKLLAAVIEELEEGNYFEEPKKEKGGKKDKKAKKLEKLAKSDVEDMDQKELEDVNDKYELGLDLDEIKSLRKMVKAVVDALEENDYLED